VRCPAILLVGVVVVLTIGLAEPAATALAVVADAPTLLPADQTPDDGNDRSLFLVPTLGTAVLAQGSLIVGPAPQTRWPAGHGAVWDLARAPPPQPGHRFVLPRRTAV